MSCNPSNERPNYDFETHFEKSEGLETATYEQTIEYYNNLAETYSEVSIQAFGKTDSGKPLHIVTLNADSQFDFSEIRKNKRILLINNGIHPGESDGIDATMLLYRDLALGKITSPKNTTIATIPIYNVGGSLNRNSATRTNQNGPKEYGFRGNAQNLDLNRDFVKYLLFIFYYSQINLLDHQYFYSHYSNQMETQSTANLYRIYNSDLSRSCLFSDK